MDQLATNSHLKWMKTFWKINNPADGNKRAGWNIRAGGNFFLKINKHANQNKTVQGGIFSQNNKRACTSIRYTRVHTGLKDWDSTEAVEALQMWMCKQ